MTSTTKLEQARDTHWHYEAVRCLRCSIGSRGAGYRTLVIFEYSSSIRPSPRSSERVEHDHAQLRGLGRPTGTRGREGHWGVEGLVLLASGDPAALNPISGPHGKRYFVYKAFLAVVSSAARCATVSIVSPASATLYYGSSGGVDELVGRAQDRAMVWWRREAGCDCRSAERTTPGTSAALLSTVQRGSSLASPHRTK